MRNNDFWRDRKAFVTGATGFIGAWLVDELLKKEAQVFALVRRPKSLPPGQKKFVQQGLTIVRGSVEDLEILQRTIKTNRIDTVFHLAAKNVNIGNTLSPMSTFETNVRGSYNVLEASRRQENQMPTVILASSKEAGLVHERGGVIREKRHPYEVSKTCMELIAYSYADSFGLNLAIVRCANVYGGGDLNWNRLIPGTIRSLLKGSRPIIRSSGDIRRDYIFVKDVVEGYLRLGQFMGEKQIEDKVIHLGTETSITALEVVKKICKMMNIDSVDPVIMNQAQGERSFTFQSTEKTRELLGWSPKYDIDTGLKETVDWYRSYFAQKPTYHD